MASRPNSSSQYPLLNPDQPSLRFSSSSKRENSPSDSPFNRSQSPTLRMFNISSLAPRFRNTTSPSNALLARITTKNGSSSSLTSANMDDGSSSDNDQFYDIVDPHVTGSIVQRISEELDSHSIMVEEEVLSDDPDFDAAITPTDEQINYLSDKGEKCDQMESSQSSSPNTSSPTQITSNCQTDLDLTRTQRRFARCFPEIIEETRTLKSLYICALEREILWHGHVFVSHNYVTFFGRLFSRAVRVMIHFADIVRVDKHNSMMILPNAIRITTLGGKICVLTSFLSRDAAYEEIYNSWWRHRNSLLVEGISLRPSKKASFRPRSSSDLLSEAEVLDFVDDSEPQETHSKEASSPLPARSNTLPLNLIRGGNNHGRESSSPFPLATSTFLSLRARSASISTKRHSRNSPTTEEYIPKSTLSTPLSVANPNDKEKPQSKRSMASKHASLLFLPSHTPNSYTTNLSLNPVTSSAVSPGSISAPPTATYSSTFPFPSTQDNNGETNEQERSSEDSFSRTVLGDKKGRGRGDSSASSIGNTNASGNDGKDPRGERIERTDGKGFLRSLGIGKVDNEKEREKEREREKVREEKKRAKDEKDKEKERVKEKEVTKEIRRRWNASRLSIGLREDKDKEKITVDATEGYIVDNCVDEENENADEIPAESQDNFLSTGSATLGNDDHIDSDHSNSSDYEDDDELDLQISPAPYRSNHLSPSYLPPIPTPCNCATHKKHLLTDTIFPIPVHALFELIFGPDPEVIRRVHERTESKDVKFGEWTLGEGELIGKKVRTVEYMFCIRLVVKRMYTACVETQSIVSVSDGVIVVDTSSIQPQVPYGGTFACVIRYCLTHEGPNQSRLRSSTEMEFKQTHFMSGKIESTALQGTVLFQKEMIKEINAWITTHPNDPLLNCLPIRRRLSVQSSKSKIVSRRKNRRHRGGLTPMHESVRIPRHRSSSRQRLLPESDASISASSGLSRGLRSRTSNVTSKVSTTVTQKHKPSISVTSVMSTAESTSGAIASNSSYIANIHSSYPVFHLFSSLFVGLVSLLQNAAERNAAAILAFTRTTQNENSTGESPRWLRLFVVFGFAMVCFNLYSIGMHSLPSELDPSPSPYSPRHQRKPSSPYRTSRQNEFQSQINAMAHDFHRKLVPLRKQAMQMRNEVDEMLKTLDMMGEAAARLGGKVEWRRQEDDYDDYQNEENI